MVAWGMGLVVLAVALLTPRDSGGRRQHAANRWRSSPLMPDGRDMTLATDAHHARWGKGADRQLLSQKYARIRIGLGLLCAVVGVVLLSL